MTQINQKTMTHTLQRNGDAQQPNCFSLEVNKERGLNGTSIALIKASKQVAQGNDEVRGQTMNVHKVGTQYNAK